MSFRGLDLSRGFEKYADLMKQADSDRRAMQIEAQNRAFNQRIQGQQSAALYGFDSPEVDYTPMSGLGEPQGSMDPYSGSPQRGPSGRMEMFGQQDMMQSADQTEADFLSRQLSQGTVNRPTGTPPPRGSGAIGSNNSQDRRPQQGQMKPGGGMWANQGTIDTAQKQYNKLAGREENAPINVTKQVSNDAERASRISEAFDGEIASVIQAARDAGRVRGSMVHPMVARQIQELKGKKLAALSQRESQQPADNTALIAALINAQKPVAQRQGRAPVDPGIAIKRKMDMITSMITPRPKEPQYPSKSAIKQHTKALDRWDEENAGLLAQRDALMAESMGQVAPTAKTKGKMYEYKGNKYTAEQIKQKFPELYEKNKSKFGG